MIPACAALLPCRLATRATIVPSPDSAWYTKCNPSLPVSWLDQDVGSVGVGGSADYANGTFSGVGAGKRYLLTGNDGLHYVYQALSGGGKIAARVASLQGSSAAQAG